MHRLPSSTGALPSACFRRSRNPAVAVGLALMGKAGITSIWIHLLGDLFGGAAAGFAFRLLNPHERLRAENRCPAATG
jgi:hypothetical protein